LVQINNENIQINNENKLLNLTKPLNQTNSGLVASCDIWPRSGSGLF